MGSRKRNLSLACAACAAVGFIGIAYWMYSSSSIMEQADSGEIPGGYTTPLMAVSLFGGGLLLIAAFLLLFVRLTRR